MTKVTRHGVDDVMLRGGGGTRQVFRKQFVLLNRDDALD